jgi:hypothetical protein
MVKSFEETVLKMKSKRNKYKQALKDKNKLIIQLQSNTSSEGKDQLEI